MRCDGDEYVFFNLRFRQITIANRLQKHVVLHIVSAFVGTTACNFISCSPPTTSAPREKESSASASDSASWRVESHDSWDQHVAMEPAGNLIVEIPHTPLRTAPRALTALMAPAVELHTTTIYDGLVNFTSACICGRVETWDGCNFLSNTSVFLTPFQSEAWSICSKPIVHQRLLKDGVGKTKHQKLPVLSTGRSCEAVPTSLAQKQTFSQMSSHSTPK